MVEPLDGRKQREKIVAATSLLGIDQAAFHASVF